MSDYNDLSDSLLERLLVVGMRYGLDPQALRQEYIVILDNYEVRPKEYAVAVLTEGRNEMFLRKFLLAKGVAGRSKRTLQMYKSHMELFFRTVGKDADTITHEDIQVFIAKKLVEGKTKCYANNYRRVLSSFYSFMMREDFITKNPINKVDAIKYHTEKEKAFSDMEIELLRTNCKNSHERAMIEILLSTGCRAAEVCSIRISEIKEDKILILGKGGKYRTVYLNAKAQIAIAGYLKERKDSNPYLFPAGIFKAAKGGVSIQKMGTEWFKYPELVDPEKPYCNESVNWLVKRVGKRAGVDGVHAHRFRRTCATQALRHGMPIEIVSIMLGHEQISTTQIYLDIKEDDLQMAHKKYVV